MPSKDATLKQRAERVQAITPILQRLYPDARCRLDYRTPLELLVATVLSAQCTDDRVNVVTRDLFRKYPDAHAYAAARQSDLEKDIRPTGTFRRKAQMLRAIAAELVNRHGGQVPADMAALTALPGVGRKSANVVLGNAFGMNEGIVVDRHVARVSARLGLTRHTDPVKIEQDLMKIVPRDMWTRFAHLLIFHSRAVCNARKPKCDQCELRPHCPTGRG